MKKGAVLLILSTALLSSLVFSGCGSKAAGGDEKEVAMYAMQNILVPKEGDTSFIVEWRRQSTGPEDVSPDELAQGFWKWEGSSLVEITADEYKSLASQRQANDPTKWVYSEHSVTVEELDTDKGEAVVEIGSLYGPLTGAGIQYHLRKEGGKWQEVDEETVWMS